jgi:hypothetical protein
VVRIRKPAEQGNDAALSNLGAGPPTRCTLMPMGKSSMPLACLRRVWLALAVALSAWAAWLPAHAADEATFDDTADCIALMQTNADDLASQIKAGDKAREPALRSELRRAGVLIGRTYLDGLHDSAEAKARLKAAQERQAAWDEERRKHVYQACVNRADAELAAASGPERFIVERYARARFDRMLREP